MSNPQFSSPISTGGGGIMFEQHVDALFLALLLVRGIPPVLKDCQVDEVHLQTEHLGWHTDDVLIVGTRTGGEPRKLAIQVKLQFTVSDKSDDCKKAIADYWADFKSGERFNPECDRLALVVQRASKALLDSFNGLSDCARASADGADFARRISTSGYLSITGRHYAENIRNIIDEIEGSTVPDDELRRFLSILHVVAYDLNTAAAASESSIKSTLAITTHESDPVRTADETWGQLLEIVSRGMPSAGTYRRGDLPDELVGRHEPLGHGQALQALEAHSKTTFDGIKTTIGNSVSISRDNLIAELLELLNKQQVAIVTGSAGSGKSGLAKSAIEALSNDHLCFVFRAEEFSAPHIDTTLHNLHASLNGQWLRACLAAQGRVVILVESVERLLEASVRDAFSQFLDLANSTQNIQIILTCRDYSVETVRTALLDKAGLQHGVMEVTPLTDGDLAEVALGVPHLTAALGNSRLKELLRSPYLLDIAARMTWSEAGDFPGDEREFRLRCWEDVVRNNAVAGGGLPQRREVAFVELAIRRARDLIPYVSIAGLDAEALDALNKDSLVTFSPNTASLASPAHDVLEDWAILQWINERFYFHQTQAAALAEDIGGYPAIRRSYRRWLGEFLEIEPDKADSLVLSTVRDQSLASQFRDDTLVSTLLSSSARAFLTRHRHSLLENDAQLLIRVIHLLRVACKAVPGWLGGESSVPSQILLAEGDAWSAIIEIVNENIESLLPNNIGILLGLLEDWAASIEWNAPQPSGFHEAGDIVFELLAHLDGYEFKDMRKRLVKVIAKIPKSNDAAFEDLVIRGNSLDRSDHAATDLAEILLTGLESAIACRDFPNQMVQSSMAHFCLKDDDLSKYSIWSASIDIDPEFGIRPGELTKFFPASAIRGPFFPLLRSHPRIGVAFIIGLTNHVGIWYAEQKWPGFRLEPLNEITIEIPEEDKITQWTNNRFWGLYRGTTVGPYLIQTALMSLESWLIRLCEIDGVDVEQWLLKLLRDSNNVAVTAVVASVCNAFPEKGGRAALAVLNYRELFGMDRARMAADLSHTSVSDFFPTYDAVAEFCNDERKKSDSLPHRRLDLEALALRLQMGGQREGVWQILDRHWGSLPPVEEQSEDHRLWRLALHRMDVRGFRPMESPPKPDYAEPDADAESHQGRPIYYGPGNIEPDIQEIVDQRDRLETELNQDLSLKNWGTAAWQFDQSDRYDLSAWQEKLANSKARHDDPRIAQDFALGGPALVAAVCVRDHWYDISKEDREWCAARLIEEIETECDSEDDLVQVSRSGLSRADRIAAFTLPLLLELNISGTGNDQIKIAISKAITHAVIEVSEYAAEGIGQHLQGERRQFLLLCVGALAKQARLIKEYRARNTGTLQDENFQSARFLPRAISSVKAFILRCNSALIMRLPLGKRPVGIDSVYRLDGQLERRETAAAIISDMRTCIQGGKLDVESELANLEPFSPEGSMVGQRILQILSHHSDSALADGAYLSSAVAVIGEWDRDEHVRSGNWGRNYELETVCLSLIVRYAIRLPSDRALQICKPFINSVTTHSSDISRLIDLLVLAEDQIDGESSFWLIWQAFADSLCNAPWIASAKLRYSTRTELINSLFLGNHWKRDIRHWRRLDGEESRIDGFVKQLPVLTPVLLAYFRFLYQIGEPSMPEVFVTIAELLLSGDSLELLSDKNSVFYLESLLRRRVYGEPQRLKSDSDVRSAVLQILDHLVEAGSSSAYRMRDDFVTPVPTLK